MSLDPGRTAHGHRRGCLAGLGEQQSRRILFAKYAAYLGQPVQRNREGCLGGRIVDPPRHEFGYDGATFRPVCLSDCYPQKAILYHHDSAAIHAEPSGNCSGSSDAELGGLTTIQGGFWLTFVSNNTRQSHDVALVKVLGTNVGAIHWLTDTAGIEETNAHLVPYGSNFLAFWKSSSTVKLVLLDPNGAILMGPEDLAVDFTQQTDMTDFSNGDAGWAWGSGSHLKIARIRLCQ